MNDCLVADNIAEYRYRNENMDNFSRVAESNMIDHETRLGHQTRASSHSAT